MSDTSNIPAVKPDATPRNEKGRRKYTNRDWPALLAEFDTNFTSRKITSLKEFCSIKDLNYSETSKNFSEIKKDRIRGYKSLVESKLAITSLKAIEKLDTLVDSQNDDLAAKVSLGVLDRAGHNPQSATLNIQQNNSNQVVLAPIFSGSDPALKDLLGIVDAEVVEQPKEGEK